MKKQKKALWLLTGTILLSCSAPPVPFHPRPLPRFFSLHRDEAPPLEKPAVIPMPSPNQNARPEGAAVSAIVLHHTATASDALSVGKFFTNPSAGVSAHYTVDRTGYIVQSVEDALRAWHAGKSEFEGAPNVNHFSVGIEICNVGDGSEPYPDTQYDAVIRLVAYLIQTHQVPLARITRHRDVAIPPGRKVDTSDNFSVARVMEGVQQILDGTYAPPPPPPEQVPPAYPPFRTIRLTAPASLEVLADTHLDNPIRWKEIRLLNPDLPAQDIPAGTQIKLPTDFRYFEQALKSIR